MTLNRLQENPFRAVSRARGRAIDSAVEFKSDLFMPFLSEDAQVNLQHYGAELAAKGVETSYPNSEDWGWFIEYIPDDNEYWLCCTNTVEDGSAWRVYLDPKSKSLFGRNKTPLQGACPLLKDLAEVLSETDAMSDIVWSPEFPS